MTLAVEKCLWTDARRDTGDRVGIVIPDLKNDFGATELEVVSIALGDADLYGLHRILLV